VRDDGSKCGAEAEEANEFGLRGSNVAIVGRGSSGCQGLLFGCGGALLGESRAGKHGGSQDGCEENSVKRKMTGHLIPRTKNLCGSSDQTTNEEVEWLTGFCANFGMTLSGAAFPVSSIQVMHDKGYFVPIPRLHF
jgi:hypothetical protein